MKHFSLLSFIVYVSNQFLNLVEDLDDFRSCSTPFNTFHQCPDRGAPRGHWCHWCQLTEFNSNPKPFKEITDGVQRRKLFRVLFTESPWSLVLGNLDG